MSIADFWKDHYLQYNEGVVNLTGKPRRKPSTLRGYKQIWKQHLEKHFGKLTLQQYEPSMGSQLLRSLTSIQGKNTLMHVRAVGVVEST